MKFTRMVLPACLLLVGTAFAANDAKPALPPMPPKPGFAAGSPMLADQTLLANSDAIISGTVATVTEVITENPGYRMYPGGHGPRENRIHTLQATIQVDQALLGAENAKSLRINLALSPSADSATAPATELKVGDKKLFFLRQSKEGYNVVFDKQGIVGIDKVNDIEKLIKAQPFTISVSLGGNLYFGKFTAVTIKVKNVTDAACTVKDVYLNGYYLAKRMEDFVPMQVSLDGTQIVRSPLANPLSVPAHEERTVSFFVSSIAPPSLAILGADSLLLAPISLRAAISYSSENEKMLSMMHSAYVIGYAGYPLLKPDESTEKDTTQPVPAHPTL